MKILYIYVYIYIYQTNYIYEEITLQHTAFWSYQLRDRWREGERRVLHIKRKTWSKPRWQKSPGCVREGAIPSTSLWLLQAKSVKPWRLQVLHTLVRNYYIQLGVCIYNTVILTQIRKKKKRKKKNYPFYRGYKGTLILYIRKLIHQITCPLW